MKDARRRRWIPLDAQYPHSNTANRIKHEFGNTGLLTWIAFLTACKRNEVQGEFWYVTETEAWLKLGVDKPNEWTLDDFWTLTGHLKKTRRTRSGDVLKTICTSWEDWNNTPRTGTGRRQKPTNYGDIPDYETRRNRAISAPKPRHDSDSDSESEREREALATKPETEPVDNSPGTAPPIDIKRILKEAGLTPTTPQPLPRDEQLKQLKDMQ